MHEQALSEYLESFLTDNRKRVINKVLENRTRYVTVVLEDIYQSQNASAIVRTCDCLGIQNIHIIEDRNKFVLNPDVIRGADGWLDIQKHKNTQQSIDNLKQQGYRIIATSPHEGCVTPDNINLQNGKTAIIFGTESSGITNIVKTCADEFLHIPMFGFTESLNISVAAAITLYSITNRLHSSTLDWQLTRKEIADIKLKWLLKTIKKSHLLEKRFTEEYNYQST